MSVGEISIKEVSVGEMSVGAVSGHPRWYVPFWLWLSKMSGWENISRGSVLRGNVRRGCFWSRMCPSEMCLVGKCPSRKCPSQNCPSGMCLSGKYWDTIQMTYLKPIKTMLKVKNAIYIKFLYNFNGTSKMYWRQQILWCHRYFFNTQKWTEVLVLASWHFTNKNLWYGSIWPIPVGVGTWKSPLGTELISAQLQPLEDKNFRT